jgi:hypothetical protein
VVKPRTGGPSFGALLGASALVDALSYRVLQSDTHLVKSVTKSSPNESGTPCYALDSDEFPPHHQVPPNGTLEAPLPPVRGFSFF